jgi:hypothetical protein
MEFEPEDFIHTPDHIRAIPRERALDIYRVWVDVRLTLQEALLAEQETLIDVERL